MSNRLVETMKTYGLEAKMLGTEDKPSPDGKAIGDMLMRLLSLEDENAELKAQVTRLQNTVRGLANRLDPQVARPAIEAHTKPGDLD